MSAEIGRFAIALALMTALAQSLVPMIGAWRADLRAMQFGDRAAILQFLLVAVAFGCLVYAFVGSDFSLLVVATNSASDMPLLYRFTGTWGNHEGSMLLWSLILALFGATIALFGQKIPDPFRARVLAVQALIGVGFLAFILFSSNPFAPLFPVPAQGNGLNPLLQDPGLAFHPPFLYLGYVGFSTAFSFAAAALVEGRLDGAWARYARPWILAAWTLLTIGICGGSVWAYYTLGWGGWWGWDPVENASLMPWLLGTALLHSALVVERRQAFMRWTVLLSIMTFSMSLVGTFVVRSGILSSVHAFALDPERGIFILGLIIAATGGGFALYALRSSSLAGGLSFETVSRETSLLVNNVLLVTAASTVFVGTFYPLFIDLIGRDKISVGTPYYALTFVPLALPLLAVLTIGPLLKWRGDRLESALRDLRVPVIAAAMVTAAVTLVNGLGSVGAALGFGLATWIVAGSLALLVRRLRIGRVRISESLDLASALPAMTYGVIVAHIGMGLLVAGVAGATFWKQESVVALGPGETSRFAGYEIQMISSKAVAGPNYQAQRAMLTATKDGETSGRIFLPELRFFPQQRSETTQASIQSGLMSNLYISIGQQDESGRLVVRMFYHPFVVWIWIGALFMAAGGLFAWSNGRFRSAVRAILPARQPRAAAPAE